MTEIAEITEEKKKSDDCRNIIQQLPEWFGLPHANARYINEIVDKDVFGAIEEGKIVGLLALSYYFQKSAEIWWMGIEPTYHGRGLGKALVGAAKNRAKEQGCDHLLVTTLSPRREDKNYAKTRAFYEKVGFAPLIEFNENDFNPMMCMMMTL